MANTNQITEIEYCETCGTMIVAGKCGKCDPVTATQTTRPRITKKVAVTKSEIHTIGVDYITEKLIDQGITTTPSDENGIDLILNSGETILVRAMSDELRLAVGVSDLNDLKSDYLVVISNLKFLTRKICILPIDDVKEIAIDKPRRATGISDYFIDRAKYIQYRNNYNILMGE